MRYTVSDFNGEIFHEDTIKDATKKKIALLYDMRILKKGKDRTADPRTKTVKKILLAHKNEVELDRILFNVVRGNETLDDFITKKEKELGL